MPYLNPSAKSITPTPVPQHTPTVSPVVAAIGPLPLPVHSHGRRGHRRSFSYTPSTPSDALTPTGAFTPLASLPRRKAASFHLAVEEDEEDSSPEDNSPPKEPAPISQPQPTTQQQSNGRSSRSSSLSSLHGPPAAARYAGAVGLKPTPAGKPTNLNTDDEDDGRGLPPLKLRIPGLGGFGSAGSGASSPRGVNSPRGSSSNLAKMANAGALGSPVPFPTKGSSSPPRSRTTSNPVDVRITAATPSTACLESKNEGGGGGGTDSPRPSFSRTSSSPMILANGKPLKSSLKSSSSSPNIPFPSQSILPSRLYAEIAQAQRQREQEERDRLLPNQRHARAASAPNLPNFDVSSLHRRGDATPTQEDSPPYEEGEDEEDEAETPGYEIYGSHHTAPSTPSAPKAVHFPSTEEGGLTTVRVFKRTAKPVNLLLPGASGGEETETETDGEGYNSGPGAGGGAGYHYGIHNTWGFSSAGGGYQNPWDRYTRQNMTAVNTVANRSGSGGNGGGAGAYPFPRIQGSGPGSGPGGRMVVPTRQSPYSQHLHQGQHAFSPSPVRVAPPPSGSTANPSSSSAATSSTGSTATNTTPVQAQAAAMEKRKEKKRIVYELDSTSTSTVPKRDLAMFDNVFLESVNLHCTKGPLDDTSNTSESSEEEESDGAEGVSVSPRLNCILEGTLLVRNVAYEKHVSVRFTLDDWHTTSEVKAAYSESLGSLPDKWRSWVLGDRSSSTPSSPISSGKASSLPGAPAAGSNPQWDRFKFTINLSDYARGRSLSSRTLWLVIRYAVPGDVRVPVPKLLPGFNFNNGRHSGEVKNGGGEDEKWDSELLGRCERDMVDMVVRGLGLSTSSNAGGGKVVPVRQMLDAELRKRQIGVGSGNGCEWWDNNASGNYRVGFREREVVVVSRPVAAEAVEEAKLEEGKVEEEKLEEPAELGLPPLAQRRKNVSSPPAFTNSPTSINAYSSLSPPQLSSSNSADSSDLQTHHRSSSSGSLPSSSLSPTHLPTSYSTGNLTSLSSSSSYAMGMGNLAASGGGGSLATGALPNMSGRRAETTKAMAETTLERLKRLNLRNYAAPGGGAGHVRAVSSPGVISSPSPTPTTPTPPTIVTTPTANVVSPPMSTMSPPHVLSPPPVESNKHLGVGTPLAGGPIGRTSSNPLPLGTMPAVVLPDDRRNPHPSPLAVAHLDASSPSSNSSSTSPQPIEPSHSQDSSISSISTSSSKESEAGTNDSTPLTSPLHTPTMGAVDIPSVVRVRGGTGSEEASPNSEGGGSAAVNNWRASSGDKIVKEAEREKETTPTGGGVVDVEGDGRLRPLLSRNSTVILHPPPPPPVSDHEDSGAKTPTNASAGLSIPIPARSANPITTGNDILSPLLEPMMNGAPPSFGGMSGLMSGGMELGTSPPFSSLGEAGSFGGRTLSATNLNLNFLPDFGMTGGDMGGGASSVVASAQPALANSNATSTAGKRGPVPVPLNLNTLKPKQIGILEGIREKSTSSPPRSPSGSGRNSPAPLSLPRSFSGSSLADGAVVNRVEGITGSVQPPSSVVGMTPLSSLRDSTTASSLLDTPKAGTTLTPASGRRVVSAQGALGGKKTTTSPATSGSESSKSGSGSSASGKKSSGGSGSSGTQKRGAGARSPPPRGGLGLVFAAQQGGTRSPGSSPLVPPPPMSPSSLAAMGAAVGDDIRDPDSIYQAFVKQWCFASAPSPAQGGGFGRKI